MTEEQRQHTMDFILAQQAQFWGGMQKLEESQAQFWAGMQKLEESQAKSEQRTDRLERVAKLAIKAEQRRFAVVTRAIAKLGEAQAHSDRRVDALVDIIRERRNGSV